MKFSGWLNQEREKRGLTMQAVADRADITQPFVSSLERDIRNPSREMVERLARALCQEDGDAGHFQRVLSAGLRAAGFASEGDDQSIPIEYEPVMDELRSASYDGSGLAPDDVDEIAEYIRMKAKRRAQKRGAD